MGVAVAAGVIIAAGTAYSMYSSYQQGKIAKAAGERNAALARQAAADAEQRGNLEASKVLSAGVRDMAKAKASMLAQGIDGTSTGLADLLGGMASSIALDSETVKNNAMRQAWGLENQAVTSQYEGEIAAYRTRQEMWGAGLSGLGQIASIAAAGGKGGGAAKSGMETKG